MQNMIIATPVLSDAATITGNVGAGDFGINNLKKMSLKNHYRVTGTAISLTVDLLSAHDIDTVALIAHTLSATASVRVRASNTNNPATAPFDTGTLPARSDQSGFTASGYALAKNLFLYKNASVLTYRYWFVDVSDTASSYIDIGRLYVSKCFQPSTNMDYGFSDTLNDPSQRARTVSGEVIPLERQQWKSFDFTLGYLSEDEMYGDIAALEIARGTTKDVLMVVDPDKKDFLQYRSVYGTLSSITPKVNHSYSLYSRAFRIEEIPS